MLLPRVATTMMIRKKVGMIRNMSVMRLRMTSTQPPKNPEMLPTTTPITAAIPAATRPTASESRAP